MFLGAMFFFILYALRSTFSSYLLWGWTALLAVDQYLYGFMTSVRLNLVFALLTLISLLANYSRLDGKITNDRTTILLFIWLIHGTLAAVFSYSNNFANWDVYEKFIKGLVFVIVMPMVVTNRSHLHTMIVMVCLGLGFHGCIDGLKFLASGGGHIVRGLNKFGDNNHYAVTIVMTAPFLMYLYQQSKSRLVKLVALFSIILTSAAVVGTHSRGGFLTLLVALGWMLMVGKRKFIATIFLGIGVATIISLAPENWTERMETIKTAEEDSSFLQRVEAWQVSSAIALSNPVFGGGFHAVQSVPIWTQFRGNPGLLGFMHTFDSASVIPRAAHSIYFEVLGDLGFTGLFIFLAWLANILITCRETRTMARKSDQDMAWAIDMSHALTAVTLAYIIGGGGVSLAYTEIIMITAMLAEMLKRYVRNLTVTPSKT